MILKVSDLHELEMLLFMHDYTNGKLPSSFDDIYRRNNETVHILPDNQTCIM